MYLTETHLHTKESSPCGRLPAAEMLALCRDAGINTVCITDHYSKPGFDRMGLTSTAAADRMDLIRRGWDAARDAAARLGLHVICGAEIQLYCADNHYLVYGMEEDFFSPAGVEDLLAMTLPAFSAYCRERGMFLIQAHPYRHGCAPVPEYVDAMESLNGKTFRTSPAEVAQTEEIARAHGLPLTAGSDAHTDTDIAGGLIATEKVITSAAEYIGALISGAYTIVRG